VHSNEGRMESGTSQSEQRFGIWAEFMDHCLCDVPELDHMAECC